MTRVGVTLHPVIGVFQESIFATIRFWKTRSFRDPAAV